MIRYLVVLLMLSGCAHRAYPGAERPPGEVSRIVFSRTGSLSFEELRVNDERLPLFSESVEVLPGKQRIFLRYRLKTDDCTKSRDASCIPTIARGVCSGTVETKPGQSYLVSIDAQYTVVTSKVWAKGYFDLVEREDEPDPGAVFCTGESGTNWP